MQQFNLYTWLKNKSRKVVTRDGRPVRILCTDAKAKDGCCIIAAIETDGEEEGYQFFKDGKAYSSKSSIEDCADLFFADDEDELTEFEKTLSDIIGFWQQGNYVSKDIKTDAKTLLDFARNKILKDLPKWKKATENKDFEKHVLLFEDDGNIALTTVVYKDEYYIELDDLKRLPNE